MSNKAAIIIGLNYRGSANELPDCELDADRMEALYRGAGYATHKISSISGAGLKSLFEGLAKNPPGDLMVYYSGHGTQYGVSGAVEADGTEEALCLWNGHGIEIFSDDFFKALIEAIPCKVTVILDSCFSGGMDREARPPGLLKRFAPVEVSKTEFKKLARPMPFPGNETAYLFASGENQFSNSTGDGGAFTNSIMRSVKQGYTKAGDIVRRAVAEMPYQKAKLVGDEGRVIVSTEVVEPVLPKVDLQKIFKTSIDLKKLPEYLIVSVGVELGAAVDEKFPKSKNAEIVFKAIWP